MGKIVILVLFGIGVAALFGLAIGAASSSTSLVPSSAAPPASSGSGGAAKRVAPSPIGPYDLVPIPISAPPRVLRSDIDPAGIELAPIQVRNPKDIRPEANARYQLFLQRANLRPETKAKFDSALHDIALMYRAAQDRVPGDYREVEGIQVDAYDRMRSILSDQEWTAFRQTIGVLVLEIAASVDG